MRAHKPVVKKVEKCDVCGRGPGYYEGCSHVICSQRKHITNVGEGAVRDVRGGLIKRPTNRE